MTSVWREEGADVAPKPEPARLASGFGTPTSVFGIVLSVAAILAIMAVSNTVLAHDIYSTLRDRDGHLCCGGQDCAPVCLPRAASSETSAVTRDIVGGSNAPVKPAAEPASQPMNTEKTNGESTPPAITSFSPARRGASSPRKCSPMGWSLTIVPSVLRRSRT
jgi:hypothetical protein